MIVYFSSVSGYTHKFVEKLDMPAQRIPILQSAPQGDMIEQPYVLITPTYGASGKGFVPKQVVKFLNIKENRINLRGVIASGNTNFGTDFCMAGKIIAAKCNVPLLYKFELSGFEDDTLKVQEGLKLFWEAQSLTTTN